MNISDELLMSYADGELDAPDRAADRAAVEAAIKTDATLARRVEQHRALRRRLSATYDSVLNETVPDNLVAAIRAAPARASVASSTSASGSTEPSSTARDSAAASAPLPSGRSSVARASAEQRSDSSTATQTSPTGTVSSLDRARLERAEKSAASATARARWSLPQWSAMAASVVIGVLIGHFALNSRDAGPIASHNGQLVAQSSLADALSNQLASDPSTTSAVQIGTSFKAKSGAYCRTFTLHDANTTAGLACRAGANWNINTLARVEPTQGETTPYRQAGSEMPTAIRAQVESQIVGDPLDSSGEAQAKANGWK